MFFCHRDIPQNLLAETRPRVATRLTLSGGLQPAGDQGLFSAAWSSVGPVMNQAGLQWRIETKGEGHQKEGYVWYKNSFPFSDKS